MPYFRTVMALTAVVLFANGCQSVGKALGAGKNPPDEFAIVTKAPLTVPPDYGLRPPKVGETRPERLSTSDRTRQLLIGNVTEEAPSTGELTLLQSIDALNVDGNIRAILAAENGGRADKSDSLANQLIFWRVGQDGQIDDSDAPLRVDDPEAWKSERLESIESITGGEPVSINRDEKGVLRLPGVQ